MRKAVLSLLLALALLPGLLLPVRAGYMSLTGTEIVALEEFAKEWRMIRVKTTSVTLKRTDPGVQVTFTDNAAPEHPTYTYTSSAPEVATVDESGWVTPVAIGRATITISSPATEHYQSGGDYMGISVRYDEDTEMFHIEAGEGGDVRVTNRQLPVEKETVEFVTTPQDFFVTDQVEVYDAGGYELAVHQVQTNLYRFSLPKSWPVDIRVSFRRIITPGETEHGRMEILSTHANPGENQYVLLYPEEGYRCGTVTVTNATGATREIAPLRTEDGSETEQYHFFMPEELPITIRATFVAMESPADPPGASQNPVPQPEPQPQPEASSFADVPAGCWYEDAVAWATEQGIVQGKGDHTFGPEEACTRAQAVVMLWRASGSPAPSSREADFRDVPADSYYGDAVQWAVEEGIVGGVAPGEFAPDRVCSRGEIVTLLWRLHGSPAVSAKDAFPDVPAGSFCREAVSWAAGRNLVNGTGDGLFSPQGGCTRSQITTILYRDMG